MFRKFLNALARWPYRFLAVAAVLALLLCLLPLRVDAAGKNKLFDFSASTAEEKEQILFDKPGSFTAGASKKGIR